MWTSTIIPGARRSPADSMSIRTGSRWVILVKFPLGFGLGSSAKLPVVALPMVRTRP